MVKTWNAAWFTEEGTRLLYLVPRARTDELLPLTVEPKPTEIVRVLVGRHDFLTPEQESNAEFQMAKIQRAQAELTAAEKDLARIGRSRARRPAAWPRNASQPTREPSRSDGYSGQIDSDLATCQRVARSMRQFQVVVVVQASRLHCYFLSPFLPPRSSGCASETLALRRTQSDPPRLIPLR